MSENKLSDKLEELLREWDTWGDPNTLSYAEDLISALRIELEGKMEIIKQLEEDIAYYKRTQYI